MNEWSKRLKKAINDSGLSQRELEIRTGIPHSAIQRYAAGITDRIPIGRIELLAEALDTTAEAILGWDKDADSNSNEKIMVELFRMLPAEKQEYIIASIKGLLDNQ